MKYVLVTGSNGMLGRRVVKGLTEAGYHVLGISIEEKPVYDNDNYIYRQVDITKCLDVEALFDTNDFSHIIHLAAIAHTFKGMDDSWSQYYRINTICSKTIFRCAEKFAVPVFFASSIDVYGVKKGEVDENTALNPIGKYARSKALAEKALIDICKNTSYAIARFAPIYTEDNKKDMRKRFFLKYPNLSYTIGKGREYEFISVERAAKHIIDWVRSNKDSETISVLADDTRHFTKELIKTEKEKGNAKIVIYIPEWFTGLLNIFIKKIFKENSNIYFMVSKIIDPIKIKR